MSLTYSQNFLLLNTIRSSIYRKHRLSGLASSLWPHLIMLSKNHFCENEDRGKQGEGGTVVTDRNSNDLTKKVSLDFTKMLSIKNSTI